LITRDDIVRRAAQLIGTPECKGDVEGALNDMAVLEAQHNHSRLFGSKSSKKAAEQFSAALRKVRDLTKNLPEHLHFALFGDWVDRHAEVYNGHLKFAHAVARLMEASDQCARMPSGKPARSAYKKRLAAEEALRLLREYGARRVTVTKRSDFCRLAALLCGEPQADLQQQCRAELGKRRTGAKKVPVGR
jgi:hypothetical protein